MKVNGLMLTKAFLVSVAALLSTPACAGVLKPVRPARSFLEQPAPPAAAPVLPAPPQPAVAQPAQSNASSAAPAPTFPGYTISFELSHINYDDLEKEVPTTAAQFLALDKGLAKALLEASPEIRVADLLRTAVADSFSDLIKAGLAAPAAAASASPSPAVPAAVPAAAATPEAATPPAAPAPGPAAALMAVHQAPVALQVPDVFVEFQPGQLKAVNVSAGPIISSVHNSTKAPPAMNLKEPAMGEKILRHVNPAGTTADNAGRTTMVQVTITEHTGNGVDELPKVEGAIQMGVASGTLATKLQAAIKEVTGIQNAIANFTTATKQIKQWGVDVCKAHMEKVVKTFSVAYTRRMVPTAIFNECTNFMPVVSFSHDVHPTALDVRKCREATVKFVKYWNYGQGPAGASPAPAVAAAPAPAAATVAALQEPSVDMSGFCVEVCEYKYGKKAPQCHVSEGNNLIEQGH